MFSKFLVFVLTTVVFARPDVSHLKKVEIKNPVTSYDVPLSSVDKKYVKTNYYQYGQQNVPSVTILPPLVFNHQYTSGNIVPDAVSSSSSAPYGILGQYGVTSQGGQGYHVYGGGSRPSGINNQGIHFVTQQGQQLGQQGHGVGQHDVHYIIQQGGGQPIQSIGQQGIHFVTQQGQGVGQQGTHFVTQQGQGIGHQGVQFVSQAGEGAGHQNVHFITQQGQDGGHGVVTTQVVHQPVHHEIVNTQFVSKPALGSHFVTGGQGGGHVNVAHGGLGHQQQYVKNEEHVYYFSAPEELQHKTRLRINVVPTHTKKSNVIFVNAPSSPEVIPEVVVPPHQVVEDKTKVVVLVKEHDQFVPISVPAPIPVSQGKAEVFVVKYHDKNDADRIVSGIGTVHGSSFIQQDKPGFVNTINANIVKHQGISTAAVTALPSYSTQGSGYGTHSVNIVSTTPKVESYTIRNAGSNVQQGDNLKVLSSIGSNAVGNQANAYEVKTIETVKSTPAITTFAVQNLGGNIQDSSFKSNTGSNEYQFDSRFGGAVDGSENKGYTIQRTEFVHNVPSSESVGYDNIEQIQKILGQSGKGIDLVSISKGTLEGSAVGPEVQQSFIKSLGLDSSNFEFVSDGISQDGTSFIRNLEINESPRSIADLPLQSRSEEITEPKQIQIGNDVAEIHSGTSLIS